MRRRSSDFDDQIPLADQFSDPLSLVPDISIQSPAEVSRLFQDAVAHFSQKQDWELKVTAIKSVLSYLRSGSSISPEADFSALSPGIADCVMDQRSALVRWGSLYTAACSQVLQSNFVFSVETLVPALFRQLGHGTAVIANSCRFALLEMAKYVQHRRLARAFLLNQSSKSPVHRVMVVEFIGIAMDNWSASLSSALNGGFSSSLKQLSDDPAQQVRRLARALVDGNPSDRAQSRGEEKMSARMRPRLSQLSITTSSSKSAKTPVGSPTREIGSFSRSSRGSQIPLSAQMAGRRSSIPPQTQPIVGPSQSLFESDGAFLLPAPLKSSGSEIDSVMPPKSSESAARFFTLLSDICQREDYEPLEGLDAFLPSSIVAAKTLLVDGRNWREILPGLFQQFPEAFEEQLDPLFAAFRFRVWIVDLAVQTLGVATVIRRAMKFPEESAFAFFVVLLSRTDYQFECTSRIRRFLAGLVDRFADQDDVNVIGDFLNPPSADDDDILSAVRERSTTRVLGILQRLSPRIAKDVGVLTAMSKELNQVFSEALIDGPRPLRIAILDFCLTAIQDTGKPCFVGLASCFTGLIGDADKSIVDMATELLSRMMETDTVFVQRVMKRLGGILDDDRERGMALIAILQGFLEKLGDETMAAYLQAAVQYLQPILSSEIVSVRRVVLGLFAEFRYKLEGDFEQFMPKFSVNQQALIEKYCARKGPKATVRAKPSGS
jgi:hypothetical protein